MTSAKQSADRPKSKEGRSDQLLAAVLVTANIHQAAQLAGIPYGTARRIRNSADFQADLQLARQEAFEDTIGRFKALASQVIDLIEGAVKQGDLRVAMWAWDKLAGMHDGDIEARLRKLEEKAEQNESR